MAIDDQIRDEKLQYDIDRKEHNRRWKWSKCASLRNYGSSINTL